MDKKLKFELNNELDELAKVPNLHEELPIHVFNLSRHVMTPTQKSVLALIYTMFIEGHRFYMSNKRIAKSAGISASAASKSITKLVNDYWIELKSTDTKYGSVREVTGLNFFKINGVNTDTSYFLSAEQTQRLFKKLYKKRQSNGSKGLVNSARGSSIFYQRGRVNNDSGHNQYMTEGASKICQQISHPYISHHPISQKEISQKKNETTTTSSSSGSYESKEAKIEEEDDVGAVARSNALTKSKAASSSYQSALQSSSDYSIANKESRVNKRDNGNSAKNSKNLKNQKNAPLSPNEAKIHKCLKAQHKPIKGWRGFVKLWLHDHTVSTICQAIKLNAPKCSSNLPAYINTIIANQGYDKEQFDDSKSRSWFQVVARGKFSQLYRHWNNETLTKSTKKRTYQAAQCIAKHFHGNMPKHGHNIQIQLKAKNVLQLYKNIIMQWATKDPLDEIKCIVDYVYKDPKILNFNSFMKTVSVCLQYIDSQRESAA